MNIYVLYMYSSKSGIVQKIWKLVPSLSRPLLKFTPHFPVHLQCLPQPPPPLSGPLKKLSTHSVPLLGLRPLYSLWQTMDKGISTSLISPHVYSRVKSIFPYILYKTTYFQKKSFWCHFLSDFIEILSFKGRIKLIRVYFNIFISFFELLSFTSIVI
jgi:hypothetical protein